MSPSTSTTATSPVPTVGRLGVRSLINCMGTYTFISGSRMIPQAAQAMIEATNHYVNMDELMEKVGLRLAEITGAQWGYITSGCAAALAQVSAACIAGADPERMVRLPDAGGMRNEVIIQESHRTGYDLAIRMTGAHMIEVKTRADLNAAIGERTALIAITGDSEEASTIPVAEMIAVARAHDVPCLVDAAAQRPDVPNRYLQMGADVVLYSGGKCLRGPQASGLALGRKDLLQAAFLNGAPHHALGRPMKAGKEEIMGLLAAVEAWLLGRDHDAEWRAWEGYLAQISAAVAGLPSVQTAVQKPGLANHAPALTVTWDPQVLNVTPKQIHAELLVGNPPIIMHLQDDGLRVMPYMMEEGDAEVVAPRLRDLLAGRSEKPWTARDSEAPACVAGAWLIKTQYVLGESAHSMTLEQHKGCLEGHYRSQYTLTDVRGQIQGAQIEFELTLGYQINTVRYSFSGTVEGDTMSGQVSLGEFGTAQWKAERMQG